MERHEIGESVKRDLCRTSLVSVVAVLTAAIVAVVPAGIASASTHGAGKRSSGKAPIVIGAPVALSGPEAFIGQADAKVAKEYVAQINAKGGISGHKIKLIVMDTKTNPATGILDVRQMITHDHVTALVGISTTTLAEAMLPLVKKDKVPTLGDVGGGTYNHPGAPYFFQIPEIPLNVAKVELGYMLQKGIKNIAWLGVDSAFGQAGLPVFEKVAKENHQHLLDTTMYPATATNLTSYLERVKGLPGEQALLVYGIPPGAFIIASERSQAGVTVPVFYGNGVALGTFPKAVGAAANGAIVVGGNVNAPGTLPKSDPQARVIKAFLKLYGSENRFAGDMYDCLSLLFRAIKAVGTKGPAIERYLQTKVKNVPGVTGVFSYSPEIHGGVLPSSLSVLRVVNGKFTILETGTKVLH